MDYKIFPPVNNFIFSPLTIAIVGFLHTIVAHLAIGGGFLLYVEERRALKEGDSSTLSFIKSISEKFLYAVVVFGSVSGLGIWFVIGMISPFSTGYLVNRFLWIFAVEWVFFFLSIFLLLIYYETWQKISEKLHLQIIRNYFISSFLTLFFINGILTFQLTPTKTKGAINLFKAFFNRTFFPSLLSRSFIAVMIISLFSLFFLSFMGESTFKSFLAKRYFKYLSYSFGLFAVSIIFYWSQIPKAQLENFEKISYLKGIFFFSVFLLAIGFLLSIFFAVLLQRLFKPQFAFASLLCILASFGLFEWIREDLRLPYLIVQRAYGNDLDVKELKNYQDYGFLSFAPFASNQEVKRDEKIQGELLFERFCGNCHTLRGLNSLNKTFSKIDQSYAVSLVRKSSFFKAPMPPFPGGDREAELIGKYLKSQLKEEPAESGEDVFRSRCMCCHNYGGDYRDLKKSFTAVEENKISEVIKNMDALTDSMPKWSGSDEEREKLSKFLSGSQDQGVNK